MNPTKKMQQEDFSIDQKTFKKVVRQDRTQVPLGTCFVVFKNHKLEVLNISNFGFACVVNLSTAQEFIRMKDEAIEAILIYNNFEIQKLQLKFAREEKSEQSAEETTIGFTVVGESLKMERIKALQATACIFDKQKSYFEKFSKVPFAFKTLIYEMKEWLVQLKIEIDQIEKTIPTDNLHDSQEYRLMIIDSMSEHFTKNIPLIYKEISKVILTSSQDEQNASKLFLREHLGMLTYGAPFASRAYFKPRGYAGDYEMMNHLYRNENAGRTLFDQCMHRYFIDEPAAMAVKNRAIYLEQKITEIVLSKDKNEEINILAIACGPAMEVQRILKSYNKFAGRKINFTLLDQDEESLKHAQLQIQSAERFIKSGFKFNYTNLAIKNIIAHGLPAKGYDLIYSAGLFDYFSDPVARMAAFKIFESLSKNGRLIIGNFSKDNPSALQMEFLLEWNLIYRSKEDLANLFKDIGSKVTVEQEELSINLFANIYK